MGCEAKAWYFPQGDKQMRRDVGYGPIRMTFGETSASVSLITVFISNNNQIATVGSTTTSQAELIILGDRKKITS